MSPPQEPLSLESYQPIQSSPMDDFKLNDLIKSIHGVLGDDGLDAEHIDAQKIIELMERYSSNSVDWNKYTLFDHSRAYTRNLVDDGNGKFNLMILAWSKGQQSPIHDHSGSHCVMKILDGELQETQYHWPSSADTDSVETVGDITDASASSSSTTHQGKPLAVSNNTVYHPNQVTYVHDNIGLHRISNPSQHTGAVSLHLYTPPYKMCKTFEEKTGRARSSGICSFYSVGGNRIQEDNK
ncbi:RmlC-like cupin domain-containing protein [Mucor mucedo]|uniref:RmlC-like cupin domain-containing protein n=1 Tax=Mucor mucedo TaxID=29922 RepID=UPI00221EB58D|nr:RmlC-like cupin domain-containing protein [Mucor mucedo]KAI7892107.1 RmlC-like cupin domain-containing protein [Mucor mucedo]